MRHRFIRWALAFGLMGIVVVAIGARPMVGQAGEPSRQYFPILNVNVPAQTDPDYQDYVGLFISAQDGDYEIYSVRGDGTARQQLTHNDALDSAPALSPDNTKIALVRYIPREMAGFSLNQVVVMNVDGSDERVLLEVESYTGIMNFKWSPTGRHLLVYYTTNHNYDPTLTVIGLDGVEQPIDHSFMPFYETWQWSPNGAYVSYTFGWEMQTQLWVFRLADDTTRPLNTNVSDAQPAQPWNLDSRSLLFIDAAGVGHTVQPDGSNDQILPSGYYPIGWIQQGAAILVEAQEGTSESLYTLPRGGGAPLLLITHTGSLELESLNTPNEGVFYQVSESSAPFSLKTAYWLDFDTRLSRQVASSTVSSYSTPRLSFNKRELLFRSTACSERLCNSAVVAADLSAAEITTTLIENFDNGVTYAYLPLSSTRLVMYGSTPAVVLMGHTPSGEVTDFHFSDSNVGNWRYAPQ